jgi:uncharacterized DUF497 family protein
VSSPAFRWSDEKAVSNWRKHGVAFPEAATVFADDHAMLRDDPEHSLFEERFLMLGHSAMNRLLVVAHSYEPASDTIRIISARPATSQEAYTYEEHRVR